jgi:hypothetical protein
MMTKWTSKNLTPGENAGGGKNLAEEFVVLLLYGKNSFGDKIYSYLKITLPNLQNLKSAIRAGQGFNPSDFGEVIAAGKGEPSREIRAEIAAQYQVLDTQQPASPPATPEIPTQKKEWDEY